MREVREEPEYDDRYVPELKVVPLCSLRPALPVGAVGLQTTGPGLDFGFEV